MTSAPVEFPTPRAMMTRTHLSYPLQPDLLDPRALIVHQGTAWEVRPYAANRGVEGSSERLARWKMRRRSRRPRVESTSSMPETPAGKVFWIASGHGKSPSHIQFNCKTDHRPIPSLSELSWRGGAMVESIRRWGGVPPWVVGRSIPGSYK